MPEITSNTVPCCVTNTSTGPHLVGMATGSLDCHCEA